MHANRMQIARTRVQIVFIFPARIFLNPPSPIRLTRPWSECKNNETTRVRCVLAACSRKIPRDLAAVAAVRSSGSRKSKKKKLAIKDQIIFCSIPIL